jgi:hypothetical protein
MRHLLAKRSSIGSRDPQARLTNSDAFVLRMLGRAFVHRVLWKAESSLSKMIPPLAYTFHTSNNGITITVRLEFSDHPRDVRYRKKLRLSVICRCDGLRSDGPTFHRFGTRLVTLRQR